LPLSDAKFTDEEPGLKIPSVRHYLQELTCLKEAEKFTGDRPNPSQSPEDELIESLRIISSKDALVGTAEFEESLAKINQNLRLFSENLQKTNNTESNQSILTYSAHQISPVRSKISSLGGSEKVLQEILGNRNNCKKSFREEEDLDEYSSDEFELGANLYDSEYRLMIDSNCEIKDVVKIEGAQILSDKFESIVSRGRTKAGVVVDSDLKEYSQGSEQHYSTVKKNFSSIKHTGQGLTYMGNKYEGSNSGATFKRPEQYPAPQCPGYIPSNLALKNSEAKYSTYTDKKSILPQTPLANTHQSKHSNWPNSVYTFGHSISPKNILHSNCLSDDKSINRNLYFSKKRVHGPITETEILEETVIEDYQSKHKDILVNYNELKGDVSVTDGSKDVSKSLVLSHETDFVQ
jgi:hypothetical protein